MMNIYIKILSIACCMLISACVTGPLNTSFVSNIKLNKFFEGTSLDMAKAIRGSDTERIKELSQQLDLNRIYIEDITFLELAMAEGKKASAAALLDEGADPTLVAGDGNAAYLVSKAEPAWLKLFLDHGLDPNAVSAHSRPILSGAAGASEEHSLSNVKLLLEYGADINKPAKYTKIPPVFEALFSYRHKTVIYLIERGANLDFTTSTGKTMTDGVEYYLNKGLPKDGQFYKDLLIIKKMMEDRGYKFN